MPVRVAVVDLPQMLSEIVKNILEEAADVALVKPSEREDADVVILPAEGEDLPAAGLMQLARRPKAKVLTITGQGSTAYLYELRPHRTALGEVSADTLLAAIRSRQIDWP